MNDNPRQPPPVKPMAVETVRAKAREVVAAALEALPRELGIHAEKWGPKLTEGIEQRFEPLNYGLPESLDAMADSVQRAIDELDQPGEMSMAEVSDLVVDWDGNAASKFHEFFLAGFPRVADNQRQAVIALRNSIRASQEIMYSGRRSAVDIADQTIAALNKVGKAKGRGFLSGILPIVGAVFAFTAGALPIKAMAATISAASGDPAKEAGRKARLASIAALGFTMLGQGATVLKAELDKPDIGGPSVKMILESMYREIDKLWEGIMFESKTLNDAVTGDIAKLTPDTMMPPLPMVAMQGVNDLNSFRPPPADD